MIDPSAPQVVPAEKQPGWLGRMRGRLFNRGESKDAAPAESVPRVIYLDEKGKELKAAPGESPSILGRLTKKSREAPPDAAPRQISPRPQSIEPEPSRWKRLTSSLSRRGNETDKSQGNDSDKSPAPRTDNSSNDTRRDEFGERADKPAKRISPQQESWSARLRAEPLQDPAEEEPEDLLQNLPRFDRRLTRPEPPADVELPVASNAPEPVDAGPETESPFKTPEPESAATSDPAAASDPAAVTESPAIGRVDEPLTAVLVLPDPSPQTAMTAPVTPLIELKPAAPAARGQRLAADALQSAMPTPENLDASGPQQFVGDSPSLPTRSADRAIDVEPARVQTRRTRAERLNEFTDVERESFEATNATDRGESVGLAEFARGVPEFPPMFYVIGLVLLVCLILLMLPREKRLTSVVEQESNVPAAQSSGPARSGTSLFGAFATAVGLAVIAVGATAILRAVYFHESSYFRPGLIIAATGQAIVLIGIIAMALIHRTTRSRGAGDMARIEPELNGLHRASAAAAPGTADLAATNPGANAGQIAQLKAQLACLAQQLDHLNVSPAGEISAIGRPSSAHSAARAA